MFKLALIQMYVEGGDPEKNLRHAGELITQAARAGAAVLLLPETFDLGWTHPAARTRAEPLPDGTTGVMLREAARRHGVYICAGLVERDGEAVYNAAVLIDPQGKILLRHRKLNELDIGHGCYGQGDRLGVAATPLGRFGIMICADAFARDNAIIQSLGYMGADIVFSPAAWAVPADHDNEKNPYGETWRQAYMPLAKDFRMWIAGASNVGPLTAGSWAGRKCIGCSLVVNPAGEEALMGPYGEDAETVLYVEIELEKRPARGTGWQEYWRQRS